MADAVYYHLKGSGTETSISFFNTNEGAAGEAVTNIPTTNMLSKPFTLRKLKVSVASDLTAADALKLHEGAIIKLIVNKDEVIKMPFIDAASSATVQSIITATAADKFGIWHFSQDGYVFNEPVTIPANTYFAVEITLATGLAADTGMIVTLEGTER